MLRRPTRRRRRVEPTVRLPHPDDYYTDSGLTWSFSPVTTTPAADQAKPDLDVWGWFTKMLDGSRRKAVIVCSALGAMGFVPEHIAAEMWKVAEGAGQEFGRGVRATYGVCKLSGKVVARDKKGIRIELTCLLCQRRGEAEAIITPLMYEAWGIKRELLKDSQS